jgi:hypothetical protein
MDELLANPAVQAAGAPFILALAVAATLRHTRLLGLAVAVAFAAVIGLTIGYSFESLTAVRKLVLVGLGVAPVILLLVWRRLDPPALLRSIFAAAAAASALWVLWRLLEQQEVQSAMVRGFAAAAYMALLVDASLRVGTDATRAASTSLILGLAAGALALVGASALLAQIGIAVAAGAGAVLLVRMADAHAARVEWTLALPAAVISGLVGLLAVFTGSLPWFALIPTLAIPWATRLVCQESRSVWLACILTSVAAAVPALIAIALAWFAAAAST